MRILVLDISGFAFELEMNEGSTIADMRKELMEANGYNTDSSLIFYSGALLEDSEVIKEDNSAYTLYNKTMFPVKQFSNKDDPFRYEDTIRYANYYHQRKLPQAKEKDQQAQNEEGSNGIFGFFRSISTDNSSHVQSQPPNDNEEEEEDRGHIDLLNVIDTSTFQYDERSESSNHDNAVNALPIREEDFEVPLTPQQEDMIQRLMQLGHDRVTVLQIAQICNFQEDESASLLVSMRS